MREETIHIVGGGMTGFTVALRLARKGIRVAVHELESSPGGLSGGSSIAGIPVERFYHCVLPTDEALLALFDELGLSNRIGWTRTRTGFFDPEGRLLDLTTTLDFLKFPPINLIDRMRLAWTVAYCGYFADWRRLDGQSISAFLRRHGGRRLFEKVWEPLLLAKLGPDYEQFAATFIWAYTKRMLGARKAKGRSEKLGFVRGRYGHVFSAFRKEIERLGGELCTGRSVESICRGTEDGADWVVRTEGGEHHARGVVLTIPAIHAARLVDHVAPQAAVSMRKVQYLGVVSEALLLKRSITPYYVLNLIDRSMPFTGVIETSNLTGVEEFAGHTLVYVPRYCRGDSPLWRMSDAEIHAENMKGLKKVASDFCEDQVVGWQMNRARNVQPVQSKGRWAELPPVSLAPGLAYVSTAQIYPWPVFNDEAVRNVDARLPEVMKTLFGETSA